MFGANKTGGISRYNGSNFASVISSFRFRYQPNKSKGEKSYRLRQDHIEYRLYSDPQDLRSGDRMTETPSGKRWTIIGIDPYDEQIGKHIEVTMRMQVSDMHQTVTVKTPSNTQPNFDPILNEYTEPSEEVYVDSTYQALIDESGNHKERWVNVVGAGKYESINYVMTLEVDEQIAITDKVILPDGDLYLIDWIYTLPYQIFYGLKKSFKSSSYE